MKRVLTFLAVMLLPLSVMAMTPVSDSTLSDVTGQAGVNINADLTMQINIGTMAWGDADGIDDANAYTPWADTIEGGYIGVTGFNITNLKIHARTDDIYNGYSTMMLKPITIDVATADKSARGGTATTTFVRFGLGALHISLDQLQFTVALADRPNANATAAGVALNLNQDMGVVTLAGMSMFINPWSYVDIYAHEGQGVTFDLDVIIDEFQMPTMSWGDSDGLANVADGGIWMTNSSAGYVGLNNFRIESQGLYDGAIHIKGAASIDVITTSTGVYPQLDALVTFLIANGLDTKFESNVIGFLVSHSVAPGTPIGALCAANGVVADPLTVIRFSFPTNFEIKVGRITGNVAVGDSATFAAGSNTRVLGDIYIQRMNMTIDQASWVDIWAH